MCTLTLKKMATAAFLNIYMNKYFTHLTEALLSYHPTVVYHFLVLCFMCLINSTILYSHLVFLWFCSEVQDAQIQRRTYSYDESGWIFVMTGLTEPLVIAGCAGKGEGYKRVIIPLP